MFWLTLRLENREEIEEETFGRDGCEVRRPAHNDAHAAMEIASITESGHVRSRQNVSEGLIIEM